MFHIRLQGSALARKASVRGTCLRISVTHRQEITHFAMTHVRGSGTKNAHRILGWTRKLPRNKQLTTICVVSPVPQFDLQLPADNASTQDCTQVIGLFYRSNGETRKWSQWQSGFRTLTLASSKHWSRVKGKSCSADQ